MARKISGLVTSVYDGDTFTIVPQNGREIKVRIIGVDTPEIKGDQPFAVEARDRLRELILNKEVTVTTYSKDRFGRTLGSVNVDEGYVSVVLVKEGLGKIYRRSGAEYGDLLDDLEDAQDEAQKKRLGVWN